MREPGSSTYVVIKLSSVISTSRSTVELAEGPQRVARALWSDVSPPSAARSADEGSPKPRVAPRVPASSAPRARDHQRLPSHQPTRPQKPSESSLEAPPAIDLSSELASDEGRIRWLAQAPSVRVSNAALDGRVELVMSPALLAEIADVLSHLGSGSGSRPKMLLKYRYRDSNPVDSRCDQWESSVYRRSSGSRRGSFAKIGPRLVRGLKASSINSDSRSPGM